MTLYYRSLQGWKYQTTALYVHQTPIYGHDVSTPWIRLNAEGQLIIQPGYCWDGASGPTWDSPCSMRGSLVHDAIFQLIRLNLLPLNIKPIADLLFHDILIDDGMSRIRACVWYQAVKLFGGGSCVPGSEQPEQILVAGREP
jgi:hypothetical protein